MLHHSILYSRNIAKQLTSVYLFLLIPFFAVGQIEKVTIERIPPPPISFKKDIPNARASGALPAMKLPFWDDFSFNATSAANIFYPNDTLWENSRRVWVNNSMGINPPSINVAWRKKGSLLMLSCAARALLISWPGGIRLDAVWAGGARVTPRQPTHARMGLRPRHP